MKVSTIIALLVPVSTVMAMPMPGVDGDFTNLGPVDVDTADVELADVGYTALGNSDADSDSVDSQGPVRLEARSPQWSPRPPPTIAAASTRLSRRQCNAACDSGGEVLEAFCRRIPASSPARRACWAVSRAPVAACYVFCLRFR